jgi:hypothetical protein
MLLRSVFLHSGIKEMITPFICCLNVVRAPTAPATPLLVLEVNFDSIIFLDSHNNFQFSNHTAWQNSFPEDKPDPKAVPVEWTNALNAAVKAGKIPNVPQSIQSDGPDSSPSYPNKGDPNSPEICSSTYQCRGNGTIWDAPDGVFGSSFDDGPQPVSLSCPGFTANLTLLTAYCQAPRLFEAE